MKNQMTNYKYIFFQIKFDNGWKDSLGAHMWFVLNGNNVNLLHDKWVFNHDTIRGILHGLLNEGEDKLKVCAIWKDGKWDSSGFSF